MPGDGGAPPWREDLCTRAARIETLVGQVEQRSPETVREYRAPPGGENARGPFLDDDRRETAS